MCPLVGVMMSHFHITQAEYFQNTLLFLMWPHSFPLLSALTVGWNWEHTHIRTHSHTHDICIQLFSLISSHSYTLSVTVRWSTEEVATQQIALIMNSQCFPFNSAGSLWAWGPHWWDYLRRQLPRLHSAPVGEKSIQKHQDDASPGGSEPGQGTEPENLCISILFWCGPHARCLDEADADFSVENEMRWDLFVYTPGLVD